jgi:hypothetical protein
MLVYYREVGTYFLQCAFNRTQPRLMVVAIFQQGFERRLNPRELRGRMNQRRDEPARQG